MPAVNGREIPKIPEISNRQLEKLARVIRPVVSLTVLPRGRYPQDEVRTFFIKLPRKFDLRGHDFRAHPRGKEVRLVEEERIKTLHVPGSAGRVFHPTIAEVLAQIPERYFREAVHVIGFETIQEDYDPKYDESGYFHVATTVLLRLASRPSGYLEKAHY